MKSSFDSAVSKAEQRLQVSGRTNYDGDSYHCFNLENIVRPNNDCKSQVNQIRMVILIVIIVLIWKILL